MTEPREVRSRDELLETVRARAIELGTTRLQIDEVAGWADGLAGKILGPKQVRSAVHESLFQLLWSLGLKLVVTEDPAALAAVRPHYHRVRAYGANQYELVQTEG